MKPDRHAEHKQHAFDSFCKKVLKCEACNGYREISRRKKHSIPFSELPEDAMEQLAAYDRYPWEYNTFILGGDVILIENDLLADALNALVSAGKLKANPMKGLVAAVSVGIVNGEAVCDLEYVEDSAAETDMNVVMTEDGRIIEVQGTAEGEPFTHEELLTLLALARGGIESIVATQKAALAN